MTDLSRAYQVAASKHYLGDAVYFSFDGFQVWLTTENGYGATNKIALEPSVCERFIKSYERLQVAIKELMDRRSEEKKDDDRSGALRGCGVDAAETTEGPGAGADGDPGL